MTTLTVNGQSVSVPKGATLLQAIHAAGVDLPTLCYHASLPPYGACRLCIVSLTAPRNTLVASCIYPVEEGMAVETHSDEAVAARRLTLEFLMKRCPESDVIREMAESEGIFSSPFAASSTERKDELCMLCGLCVRICRDVIGAAAIGFVGRGMERKVGTPFDVHSDTCIGCGACAEICPTGAIKMEDRGNKRILHTWNTTVELTACPECGRFFTPKPTGFLKEMFPEIEELLDVCPQCRQQITSRKWLSARHEA